MSNTITQISEADIKKLIAAYRDFKEAEREFLKLKNKLTDALIPGVYECSKGKINKFVQKRMLVDNEKLKQDHPEIEELIEEYKNEKEQISVIITPY